jgi:ribonuclease G
MVKTAQTICYDIFREIIRDAREYGEVSYRILASQNVIDMLLNEEQMSLANLQEFINAKIELQVEALYMQDEYDVVMI